jgi:hypothetical protein
LNTHLQFLIRKRLSSCVMSIKNDDGFSVLDPEADEGVQLVIRFHRGFFILAFDYVLS